MIDFLIENKNWEDAFGEYKKLYAENLSEEVAVGFAFFCWYLLWQWDEISFSGENLSPYEKINADKRNGISKKDLGNYLDETSDYILNSKTPEYIALIYHMKKLYPYFFKNSDCRKIFTHSEAANIIFAYSDDRKYSPQERKIVVDFFSRFALIKDYFQWLLQ